MNTVDWYNLGYADALNPLDHLSEAFPGHNPEEAQAAYRHGWHEGLIFYRDQGGAW